MKNKILRKCIQCPCFKTYFCVEAKKIGCEKAIEKEKKMHENNNGLVKN